MKQFIFSIIILTLFSCSKENDIEPDKIHDDILFESLGLDGKIVHELISNDSILIAATDQGIYSSDFSANWSPKGLQNKHVNALSIIDANTIICSVSDDDQLLNPELYKSEDFGNSWTLINNNFGGGTPEIILDLKYNPNSNELLATGRGVIANSYDGGQTWTILYGSWHASSRALSVVDINPNNNQIWAGGQNAIEEITLIQLDSSGNLLNHWINLLPAPSTVETFLFHSNNPNLITLGCEDGILRTDDNGVTWENIYPDPSAGTRFYFGLIYDNLNSEKIIAASFNKPINSPQPLLLHISEDDGTTWKKITHNTPSNFGGTRYILQRTENGKTVLYLGLFKGGVYRVEIQS